MFLYVPLILHFKCHESSILNIKSHGTYKNAAVPTTEPTTVPTVHTAVPTTNGSGGRILREAPLVLNLFDAAVWQTISIKTLHTPIILTSMSVGGAPAPPPPFYAKLTVWRH